jgi:hypothetical protein
MHELDVDFGQALVLKELAPQVILIDGQDAAQQLRLVAEADVRDGVDCQV